MLATKGILQYPQISIEIMDLLSCQNKGRQLEHPCQRTILTSLTAVPFLIYLLKFPKTYSQAFDLKAYDRVWRPRLFEKLEKLGFGGRVLSLIKSMYQNDCIRFMINGELTAPIWLLRGVKQGNIDNLNTVVSSIRVR